MVTLLSSLLGFFGAGFPALMQFFQDRSDKKHELEIMQLQIEMSKNKSADRLEEIKGVENVAEINSLYATYNTGIKWVDALNGTVRPAISYLLIILYCVVQYMYFHTMITTESLTPMMLDYLWSDDDQALFAAIISYYFGSRAFNKGNV